MAGVCGLWVKDLAAGGGEWDNTGRVGETLFRERKPDFAASFLERNSSEYSSLPVQHWESLVCRLPFYQETAMFVGGHSRRRLLCFLSSLSSQGLVDFGAFSSSWVHSLRRSTSGRRLVPRCGEASRGGPRQPCLQFCPE